MNMVFAIQPTNLDEIVLRLTPEIEDAPGPMKWHITETGPQEAPEERRQVYGDLRFEARVPMGGFLLLGPAEVVYDRPLVARPFFIEERPNAGGELMYRESIYVIDPIVTVSGSVGGFESAGSR